MTNTYRKYLNEKNNLKAVQVDKDKEAKDGFVSKIARTASRILKAKNSYVVRMEDGTSVGVFAGNSPEDAINKALKIYPHLKG